jgi:hypothetical protein
VRKFLRLGIPPLTAVLLAAAVAVVPPAGNAAAATTIYYNGAGSAPRISVVGDSTIAALRWTGQFQPLRRFNYVYDAESCRRILYPSCRGREGYAPDTVVQTMRRLSGQLGSVFVIMGGYDDSSFGFGNGVDAVMAEASRQGIPTVLWLSLRASDVSYVGPGSISNSSTFRANNRTLYSKAIQYGPRLQIADWASYAANHPEWFYSDGIHFRPAGANVAATYIADQAARVIAGQIVTPAAGRARPSAPRNLTAAVGQGVGSGNVRLTWTQPSLTGGVPITDYVVQRSWNGGATWVSLSDGAGTHRSFVVTGHTNGNTYLFRVAARNSVGWGPVSNVVSATPRPTLPSAPRLLRATAGSGRVQLNWYVPSSSGGLPITDYVVQRSWNGGATWVSLSDGLNTNRWFTVTGLTNGNTYHFRVAARNSLGWGPVSNAAAATPLASLAASTSLTEASSATTTTTTSTTTTTTTTPTTVAPTTLPSTTTIATVPDTTIAPESVVIGDLVWLDVDGDGLQDEDEPGAPGIVVVLRDPTGVEVARVVTDQFGAYEFTGLAPGSFLLEVELPDDTGFTQPDEGPDDEVDSDLAAVDDEDGTARTEVFTVPADHADAFDLGLIAAAEPPAEEPSTTAPETTTPDTSTPETTTPETTAPVTVEPTAPPTTSTTVPATTTPPTTAPPPSTTTTSPSTTIAG